jgi:type III secretory pathway lipoprotein EscJ
MEKEIKEKIVNIIRDSIRDLAYEELSRVPEKLKNKQEELKKTKAQKEEQIYNDLFLEEKKEILILK